MCMWRGGRLGVRGGDGSIDGLDVQGGDGKGVEKACSGSSLSFGPCEPSEPAPDGEALNEAAGAMGKGVRTE